MNITACVTRVVSQAVDGGGVMLEVTCTMADAGEVFVGYVPEKVSSIYNEQNVAFF